jgi:hypothetical protein
VFIESENEYFMTLFETIKVFAGHAKVSNNFTKETQLNVH